MIYTSHKRNHVIIPGREKALESFLKQEYKGIKHKEQYSRNSNSEDALTWSCFDTLSNLPKEKLLMALDEIFEDAYEGESKFSFQNSNLQSSEIVIHIGKQYTGSTTNEITEVDASIELPGKLIFIEAKLFGTASMALPPTKPHDQIARKLRIGLDAPIKDVKEFFFIFLDIAPLRKMYQRKPKEIALSHTKNGFHDKWKSAWIFNYYKYGKNNSLKPLRNALEGINVKSLQSVANNMGWLTWSDLFKTTLRSIIEKNN